MPYTKILKNFSMLSYQKKKMKTKGRSTNPLKQADINADYRQEFQFKERIYVCETFDKKKMFNKFEYFYL